MGMYVTPILEFSRDPLSDTSPTWTDVTAYLLSASVAGGVEGEANPPDPGQATFVLDNRTRRFEPDYAAGAYYPDIVDMRRFRYRVQNGVGSGTTYDEGVWHVVEWQPTGENFEECVVTCSDRSPVLAQDDVPQFDPPEAMSYADVVDFHEPWGFWPLGEAEGTRARARVLVERVTFKLGRKKIRRKIRRPAGTNYSTKAEAGSVAGPPGVYRNTPLLGVEGAILGDPGTAVRFRGAQNEHVVVAVDQSDAVDTNKLTVMAWVYIDSYSLAGVVSGPLATGVPVFDLFLDTAPSNSVNFTVSMTDLTDVGPSVTGVPSGQWVFLVGTWDGNSVNLYVDGVLEGTAGGGGKQQKQGGANGNIVIGGYPSLGSLSAAVQYVAIVEKALTAEQIANLYTSGTARGWPQQTAGERIADLATHALWSEANIQTAGRDVMPQFQHGQPRLDEIAELAHAEGPRTMWFFNGTGDPVYLGHEWQATAAAYNTVQATFGNGTSEVPYEDATFVYDNETYNEVVVSHQAGAAATATDTDSVDDRGRRVNTEWTDVLLQEHMDVEALAADVLEHYRRPAFRPVTLTLDGKNADARTQIFSRQIGHLVRVKHRPKDGTAVDRACHIVGRSLTFDRETGGLTCTWNLSRGFNAAEGVWRLGYTGFSELNTTAILA